LLDGSGVSRDASEAVRQFKESAKQGNVVSAINLGFCLYEDIGIGRDVLRSAVCFEQAISTISHHFSQKVHQNSIFE
jgi:TPR repeat protein